MLRIVMPHAFISDQGTGIGCNPALASAAIESSSSSSQRMSVRGPERLYAKKLQPGLILTTSHGRPSTLPQTCVATSLPVLSSQCTSVFADEKPKKSASGGAVSGTGT